MDVFEAKNGGPAGFSPILPRLENVHFNPEGLKTQVRLTVPFIGCTPRLFRTWQNDRNSRRRVSGMIGDPVDSEKDGVFSAIDDLTTGANIRIYPQHGISELVVSNRTIATQFCP